MASSIYPYSYYCGSNILVTGACGTIGSSIVRHLLSLGPKVVRVYDMDEKGMFDLGRNLKEFNNVRYFIGDVRDENRLKIALNEVDYVFHAAALKHVPLCEYNPFEAVKTNIVGTQNVIRASVDSGVKKVILVSTDKAVNPFSTMGATKLLAERLIVASSGWSKKTVFSVVRFGNVLKSRGSVIEVFENDIKKNKKIDITLPDMTRFFMDVSDAVKLVLQSGIYSMGGDIFILKMKSFKLIDLANICIDIFCSKYSINKNDIAVNIIGKREGEKIHESLVCDEELGFIRDLGDMYVIDRKINTGLKIDGILSDTMCIEYDELYNIVKNLVG